MLTLGARHPDLMSLQSFGDALQMAPAKGQPHSKPKIDSIVMSSHSLPSGRWRPMHEPWRDQGSEASAICLRVPSG